MKDIKIPWPGWQVVRPLGSGGFGHVYEIERDVFGKKEKAAMKIISVPSDPAQIDQDYSDGYSREDIVQKYTWILEYMAKEYKLMASMKGHSNIVSSEDFAVVEHENEIGWDLYIRMELLTPLQSLQKKVPLSQAQIIKLGKDICKALVLCQSKHIIHRDIKPQNIMVSSVGDFKLGDFGVSRTLEQTTAATKAGTDYYMAPEVIKKEKYGQRVDIYSLGLVLYILLNRGKMPFLPLDKSVTAQEMQKAHGKRIRGAALPPPADGSEALKKIVLKACAYRPEDRYRDAEEMLKALECLSVPAKKSMESSVPEKKAADPRLERLRTESRTLGIHFGAMTVTVSTYYKGETYDILDMPAWVAITEVGELLPAERASQYETIHQKGNMYSVLRLFQSVFSKGWTENTVIQYRGINFRAGEMLYVLMKELRNRIDQRGFSHLKDCVVSVSSLSYLSSEMLQKVLNRTGFRVLQTITSGFACNILHLFGEEKPKKLINLSLEGRILQASMAEYSDGVIENLLIAERVLDEGNNPKGADLVSAGKRLLLGKLTDYDHIDNSSEALAEDINKIQIFGYADSLSKAQFGDLEEHIHDLGRAASAGAAILCAYLMSVKGTLREASFTNLLVLQIFPGDCAVEIESPDRKTLLPKTLMLAEQTTLPSKSKAYSFHPSSEGNDKLTLYIGKKSADSRCDMITADLQPLYQAFRRRPNQVVVTLEVDVRGKLMVNLKSADDGETHNMTMSVGFGHIFPEDPMGGARSKKEALFATWETMGHFRTALHRLEKRDLESPTGKGLLALEKQCEKFLKKRGLQFAMSSDMWDRKREEESESLRNQALALLDILDGLEYGLRSCPSQKDAAPAEALMLHCYRDFLSHMKKTYLVRPIEAEGMFFSPVLHYAVDTGYMEGMEEGQILCELQRGYYMGEQVLRPSKVKVAK